MKRLDRYLVESSLAPSRSKAHEMIQSGKIEILINSQFETMRKPSFKVIPGSSVRRVGNELLRYVSRGGLKLEYALSELGVSPKSKRVLDVGLSTGGFAHCLLKQEALEVVGVDVGRGQLHPHLRNHPRLKVLEGVNARRLRSYLDSKYGFDLVTVDVSFISLEHILPEALSFLNPGGELLALVKPQFEQGWPQRSGRISDIYEEVKNKITDLCQSLHLSVESYVESQLAGRSGNREFFIYGKVKP